MSFPDEVCASWVESPATDSSLAMNSFGCGPRSSGDDVELTESVIS
ncbi:MAG: hypothetical protein WBC01_11315 [Solirubrobacterales bacterium]